jgi:hypothetical protein
LSSKLNAGLQKIQLMVHRRAGKSICSSGCIILLEDLLRLYLLLIVGPHLLLLGLKEVLVILFSHF